MRPNMGRLSLATAEQLFNEYKGEGRLEAVIVPDSGEPSVQTFESIAHFRDFAAGLLGRPVTVFPYIGERIHISNEPVETLRSLMFPWGHIAIVDRPDAPTPGDGYLGPRQSPEPTTPTTPVET